MFIPVAEPETLDLIAPYHRNAGAASASVALSAQVASTSVAVVADEPVVVQRSISRGAKQLIDGAAPLVPVVVGRCSSEQNC